MTLLPDQPHQCLDSRQQVCAVQTGIGEPRGNRQRGSTSCCAFCTLSAGLTTPIARAGEPTSAIDSLPPLAPSCLTELNPSSLCTNRGLLTILISFWRFNGWMELHMLSPQTRAMHCSSALLNVCLDRTSGGEWTGVSHFGSTVAALCSSCFLTILTPSQWHIRWRDFPSELQVFWSK